MKTISLSTVSAHMTYFARRYIARHFFHSIPFSSGTRVCRIRRDRTTRRIDAASSRVCRWRVRAARRRSRFLLVCTKFSTYLLSGRAVATGPALSIMVPPIFRSSAAIKGHYVHTSPSTYGFDYDYSGLFFVGPGYPTCHSHFTPTIEIVQILPLLDDSSLLFCLPYIPPSTITLTSITSLYHLWTLVPAHAFATAYYACIPLLLPSCSLLLPKAFYTILLGLSLPRSVPLF